MRALSGRGLGAHAAGRAAPGARRCSSARASSPRRRPSRTSTAPTCSSASASAATSSQSIATAVGLFNEALTLAERSGLPCDLLRSNILGWRSRCYRRQRDSRLRARTSSARSSSPRASTTGATWRHLLLPGLAARRARRPLGARPHLRRAGQGPVRGDRRPRQRRQAAEQPRRTQLPARQARGGDPLPEGRLRRCCSRYGSDSGRRPGGHLAGAGSPPHGRRRASPRSRRARRSSCSKGRVDHLDEIGNAQLVLGRALLEQDRLDEADAAFARGRVELRPAFLGSATAQRRGSPRAISRRAAATTAQRPALSAAAEALQDVPF